MQNFNKTRELTTMEQVFIEQGLELLLQAQTQKEKNTLELKDTLELSERRTFDLKLLLKDLYDTRTVKITPYK
tara:strand:- start:478 stop:696 length:219 start_codon:yes stop_codon:yes gene_type:complete